MNANVGHWLIGFICCAEPLLFLILGAWLHRRFTRRNNGDMPNE